MTDPAQHFYQAIAVIQGELLLDDTYPVLVVGDAPFPVHAGKVVRRKHKSGQVQNFRAYPCIRQKQLAFQLIKVVTTPPTSILLHGCWELHKDKPYFIIYRNEIHNQSDVKRSLVPVVWDDAPAADGQFWQAEAELKDGEIVMTQAVGPFEPPPKAKKIVSVPAVAQTVVQHQSSSPSAPGLPLTVEDIRAMATVAKISVTCKLSEVPKHRELPDKRIEFFLQDGDSERIFTVQMKLKMFKKLTEHGFTEWVAAIAGEIGPATETGFELMNASVQVFEKVARDADVGAETKTKAVAEPKPVVAEPEKGKAEAGNSQAKATGGTEARPKQGKGLLDGMKR
jgi:hypothetical protein